MKINERNRKGCKVVKVIFLDFDGVITTKKSKWRLDDEKMSLVKEICDKTGAKIVISSSWRRNDVETTLKSVFGKDYDDSHYLLNSKMVVGVTERPASTFRGTDIQKYLDTHPEIENYVILDDDTGMLDSQREHFVNTDSYLGISKEDVKQAIEILMGK